jgi:hypothetical protein
MTHHLLQRRELYGHDLCRVRIEVFDRYPQYFDLLYDLATKEIGDECHAGPFTDQRDGLSYVYFWSVALGKKEAPVGASL